MNIYLQELKANLKSLLLWSSAMLFLIVAGMGKYTAAAGASTDFNDLMNQMPKSLQNLFGVGVFDLSIALDYFGVLFLYIAIVATAHSAMLFSGIISKEESDKTAEFLLVKPVSRSEILTFKLLASLSMIIILNLVASATAFAMIGSFSENSSYGTGLFKLMTALFGLQTIFGAIGAFLACVIKHPKISVSATTGILMLMFLLSIASDISQIGAFNYFTFFKYFDAKKLLKGGYPVYYPVITAILSVGLISASFYFYKKRDIKV